MKILFLLNGGFDTPGPSNHLLSAIIERLLFEDNVVHIISKDRLGINAHIPETLVGHKNISYNVIKVKKIMKNNFIKRYFEDVKYAFSCIKHYKGQKDVDVVFLQSCNTSFFHMIGLKTFVRKPIIYNVQDIFPLNSLLVGLFNKKSIFYKILDQMQKVSYKQASRVITISDDMKDTLISFGVEESKIDVIYNWAYSDDIVKIENSNNAFIIKNKIELNNFKVVYAGNIGKVQNVEIILEAAKLLRNYDRIKFYLIGDGANKESCQQFAQENQLENVFFYPMQDSEMSPHIYSMADVNVIPLHAGIIKTALPSKTAICFSVGKPIIACVDINSKFAKLISSLDKCEVIESNDSKGLANTIEKMYLEEELGNSIGLRSVFTTLFSKNLNTRKYTEILTKSILNNKKGR